MRDFGYLIGDDAEVYVYLYNGSPGVMRQISERFSMFIPKEGYAYAVQATSAILNIYSICNVLFRYTHFNEKLHTNCCVFTDLGKNSMKTDLIQIK